MPANNSKLIQSPPLNQIFGDANTNTFAVASVYFYVNGTTTLKPVYKRTFDSGNPFEAAPNPLPLDATGALPYDIWFYPYDIDDENSIETYTISVKRTSDGTEIYARNDFPYVPVTSITSETVSYKNLFPSFDYPHSNILSEKINHITQDVFFPIPGWVIFSSINTATSFFSLVDNNNAIAGNPANALKFTSSPVSGNAGVRGVGAVNIGFFSAFSGNKFKVRQSINNLSMGAVQVQYVLYRITEPTIPEKKYDFVKLYESSTTAVSSGLQTIETVLDIAQSYPNTLSTSRVALLLTFADTNANINVEITANYLQKIKNNTDPIIFDIDNFSKSYVESLFSDSYNSFCIPKSAEIFTSMSPGVLTFSDNGIKNNTLTGLDTFTNLYETGNTFYPTVPFSNSATDRRLLYLNQTINGVSSNNILSTLVNTSSYGSVNFSQYSFSAHPGAAANTLVVEPKGSLAAPSATNWTSSTSAITLSFPSVTNKYLLSATHTAGQNTVVVKYTGPSIVPTEVYKLWGNFAQVEPLHYPVSESAGGTDSVGRGYVYNFFDRNVIPSLNPFLITYSENAANAVNAVRDSADPTTTTLTFVSANPADYVPRYHSTFPPYPYQHDQAEKYTNFIALQSKALATDAVVKPYYLGIKDEYSTRRPQFSIFFSNESDGSLPAGATLPGYTSDTVKINGLSSASDIADAFSKSSIFSGSSAAATLTVSAIPENNSYLTFADGSSATPKKYVVIFIEDNVVPVIPTGQFDHVFYFKLDTTSVSEFIYRLETFFQWCVTAIPTKSEFDTLKSSFSGLYL